MAHHIVVVGGAKEAVIAAYLLPNTEEVEVIKAMGMMNNYTHLFSLSQAVAMDDPRRAGLSLFGGQFKETGRWLLPIGSRPPKLLFEAWVDHMRTRWLGKDEFTIDSDVSEIIRQVHAAADEMRGKKFPTVNQPNKF